MRILYLGAALLTVLALACSGDEPSPAVVTRGEAVSTPRPAPDIASLAPADLIYWDTFFTSESLGEPPAAFRALLEALAAEPDPRYRAFAIDLALYPTPYREHAWALLGAGGRFDFEAILDIFGAEALRPEDDLGAYVEFKSRLMNTIVQGFGAFLNPKEPRTISAREVIWGGVEIDGIPPLNDPAFVSAEDAAKWIVPSDTVIGVQINGDARAYPRRIIDWHEMVNDTIGGVPVSLAYCTLCGSAILYDGRAGDEVYRFGTSGLLYRSNKLMYDTATRSLWEQYTGEPVWGPLVGQGVRLNVLPAVHTTWGEWLAAHPDTKVLDIETGFKRDYGSGVAYRDYWASPELRFPAPSREGPLAVKDTVFTVRLESELVAYPVALLSERSLIQDEIAGRGVIVLATPDGSGGRAYERRDIEFRSADLAGSTLTGADGRKWQVTEAALVGPAGEVLDRLPGHNSFWFAVVNHAPGWRLYQE